MFFWRIPCSSLRFSLSKRAGLQPVRSPTMREGILRKHS